MGKLGASATTVLLLGAIFAHAATPPVALEKLGDSVSIQIGGQIVGTFMVNDARIPRPHFANLRALDGTPITRTHPPDAVTDKGNDDHAEFHPGLWLAFGDIGGADVWRLKGTVYTSSLEASGDTMSLKNEYRDATGKAVAWESAQYRLVPEAAGYFVLVRSEFTPVGDAMAFGDQEEMGLGIRLATGLSVKRGGHIANALGGENEKGTWGKAAAWCRGYGRVGDGWAGAIVLAGPNNFRRSWFHSRDYGLVVANPFGRKAMTAPDDATAAPDSTVVTRGKPLVLDFGVYLHAGKELPDGKTVYRRFTGLLGTQ